MKKLLYILPFLLTTTLCQQVINELHNRAELTEFTLKNSLDSFSRRSFAALINGTKDPNFVYSPYSLHVAMSMLYYGSPENSNTHQQLAQALGLSAGIDPNRNYLLNYLLLHSDYEQDSYINSANKLFIDKSLRIYDDFNSVMNLFYRAIPQQLDLSNGEQSAQIINDFVSRNTRGVIRELIGADAIDEFTRLLIINALHFKGKWKTQFSKFETKAGPFNTLYRGRVMHPNMMKTTGTFWVSLKDVGFDGADIIDLPYENENFTMTLYISPDSSLNSVNKVLGKVVNTPSILRKSYDELYPLKLQLTMPKFSVETSKEMVEPFKSMGVVDVFDANLSDLSDIASNSDDLHVDNILHKAKIDVDEEGSEAVAATAVVVGTRSSHVRAPVPVTVDRPFIFVISDKRHEVPLFIGLVTDPSQGIQRSVRPFNMKSQRLRRRGRTLCNDKLSKGLGKIIFPC